VPPARQIARVADEPAEPDVSALTSEATPPSPIADAPPAPIADAPPPLEVSEPASAAEVSSPAEASETAPPSMAPKPAVPAPPALDGYMRDARGRLVPAALVKPEQLLEDALVRGLHEKAAKLSGLLRDFRDTALDDIEALLDLLADKYRVTLGGDRGNLTLDTYDGELIVMVSVGDQLDLGPELQIAKTLIDGCIHRWSEGASIELQAIVNDAFDVDKKGKLNVGRILALRRMNIDDADWKKAMDAIGNATRVVRSKRYLRLYRKSGDKAKEQVPLDLASV
jgi:hypothetical protein